MEYIFIPQKADIIPIQDYIKNLEKQNDTELIATYNSAAKVGIVGVRQQIRYLLAMKHEFIRRFKESPVYVTDEFVVGLIGEVKLHGNNIKPINSEK